MGCASASSEGGRAIMSPGHMVERQREASVKASCEWVCPFGCVETVFGDGWNNHTKALYRKGNAVVTTPPFMFQARGRKGLVKSK
jgi:hypothetical protein